MGSIRRAALLVIAASLLGAGVVPAATTVTGARILLEADQRLLLVDPDTGGRTDLGATEWSYDWTRDGNRIAFVSDPDGFQGPARARLWVMNVDASERRVLTPETLDVGSTEWSPDGSRLAFTNDLSPTASELYVVSHDGTGLRRVLRGPNPLRPRWAPDGHRLLVLNGRSARRYVQVLDLRSGVAKRLVDRVHAHSTPGWSPDGSRISYVKQRRLYVANANGTRSRRLSNLVVWGTPVWSPDGSRIAFESRRGPGQRADIWSVAPDGTNPRRLTRASERYAEDTFPHWSPDGAKLAFVSDRDRPPNAGRRGLFVMNADGSCETEITAAVQLGRPAWRPPWATGPRLRCLDLRVEATLGIEAQRVTRNDDRIYFYEVAIVNEGTEPATGVELRADPQRPTDQTFVSASGEGASCSLGEAVSCRLGTVAAGETKRIVVRFRTRFVTWPIGIAFKATSAEADIEPFGNSNTPLSYFPACRWTDVREPGGQPFGSARELICGTDRRDTIVGTSAAETIQGARGDDRLTGSGGADQIAGEGDRDRMSGGRGSDVMFGGSGNDQVDGGRGRDSLLGGTGNDLIRARDGLPDRVTCGPGRDRVLADRLDSASRDCERVLR
jgi:dipeptidyl aminopeptidase/acylaminoacyl peptidase